MLEQLDREIARLTGIRHRSAYRARLVRLAMAIREA